MAGISPARRAAFDVLMAVERGSAHSDELLRGEALSALSPADRNLATAIVLGVLRWQIALDARIRPLLRRPNAKLDSAILIALRIGAFQIVHLDRIPARAAIDESVELAKQAGHRFASGMVNAVLRKLAAQAAQPEPAAESAAELALAAAHPRWMVERWTNLFGLEAARVLCAHGQSQAPLTLRVAAPEVETELAGEGLALEPGELLTAARTVGGGDALACAALREGRARVQDEGSQLVAELAAGSIADLNQNPKKILDACAAPGGKTLILAERHPRAQIVACEANERRYAQMCERFAAAGCGIECRLADASGIEECATFDLALVDAPCSGTGTLGRNPEIRHRLEPEDLSRQAERQKAILSAVVGAVRPGGRIVYSTCSLEPEENEQVVAAVLAEGASARQISLAPVIEKLAGDGILAASAQDRLRACVTREGALRLMPGVFRNDGFFIALLERAG